MKDFLLRVMPILGVSLVYSDCREEIYNLIDRCFYSFKI